MNSLIETKAALFGCSCPSQVNAVVDAITSKHAVNEVGGPPSVMKHNRLCYTLALYGEFFFDFSFMPTNKLRQGDNQ